MEKFYPQNQWEIQTGEIPTQEMQPSSKAPEFRITTTMPKTY